MNGVIVALMSSFAKNQEHQLVKFRQVLSQFIRNEAGILTVPKRQMKQLKRTMNSHKLNKNTD